MRKGLSGPGEWSVAPWGQGTDTPRGFGERRAPPRCGGQYCELFSSAFMPGGARELHFVHGTLQTRAAALAKNVDLDTGQALVLD